MDSLKRGSLVISLDFEMLWGGLDSWTVDGYGKSNVAQVRTSISRMVSLFEKYDVHATFATVGFLMLDDADSIRQYQPKVIPSYKNKLLNSYGSVLDIAQEYKSLFFAPDVVGQLNNLNNIEVGTHTFSHYYCWEPGQTTEQFDADIETAQKVAKMNGIILESIVFPRNQVSKDYLEVCANHGILVYRGNARKYFEHTTSYSKNLYNKISRLLDAYINWGGNTTIPYSSIDRYERPVNVPASRMLRPYMKILKILEPLRLRRIKREMIHAAKHHELYHLWWHPHNFGAHMEQNMIFLEEVLKCYQMCHQQYDMRSYTMKEFYYKLIKNS
ncbi:MAG: polysaccharide deacetylase family protein [Bacteroidaceae bacterium]|nr:polysaccharide deacetylase family protein [Bacteroidaceae bacterium]